MDASWCHRAALNFLCSCSWVDKARTDLRQGKPWQNPLRSIWFNLNCQNQWLSQNGFPMVFAPHPGGREAADRLHGPAKVAERSIQGQRQAIEAITASALMRWWKSRWEHSNRIEKGLVKKGNSQFRDYDITNCYIQYITKYSVNLQILTISINFLDVLFSEIPFIFWFAKGPGTHSGRISLRTSPGSNCEICECRWPWWPWPSRLDACCMAVCPFCCHYSWTIDGHRQNVIDGKIC